MIRSRLVRILAVAVILSPLISCRTVDQPITVTTVTPKPRLVQSPPRVTVGISFVSGKSIDDVRPYYARARTDSLVEFFSIDGELEIQWQPVRNPLPRVECRQDRRVCFVRIPRGHPAGRYPYYAIVTAPNGDKRTYNQPEVEVPPGGQQQQNP